jgi:FkbM family methyltransferase
MEGRLADVQRLVLHRKLDALASQAERRFGEIRSRPMQMRDAVALDIGIGYIFVPMDDEDSIAFLVRSAREGADGARAILRTLVRPGDTVVDVGPGAGVAAIQAARMVGPEGRVVAVEPSRRHASLLQRTARFNALEALEVVNAAPGEASGTAALDESGPVPVEPLDGLIPRGAAVRLVRIQAPGGEAKVWRGMQRIVAENEDLAVLIELGAEGRESALPWLEEVRAAGWRPWEVDGPDACLMSPSAAASRLILLRQPPLHYGLASS